MFRNKYRITIDSYKGYQVDVFRWWFPIWLQAWDSGSCVNTHYSIEEAEAFAKRHANKVKLVKYLGNLKDS